MRELATMNHWPGLGDLWPIPVASPGPEPPATPLQRHVAGDVGLRGRETRRPAKLSDGPVSFSGLKLSSATWDGSAWDQSTRRQHHHDLAAFELGVLLDLGEVGDVGLHLVEQLGADLLVRHLATAIAQGDLH